MKNSNTKIKWSIMLPSSSIVRGDLGDYFIQIKNLGENQYELSSNRNDSKKTCKTIINTEIANKKEFIEKLFAEKL